MLSFGFELTRDDYNAFIRLVYLRLQIWRRLAFFATIVVIVQVFLLPVSDPITIVVSCIISFVVYIVLLMLALRFSTRGPSKGGSMLGYRTMHFTDEAITYESDTSNGNYRWSAILKIVETKSAFYLFIDRHMAILVPKRVFDNPEQQRRFEELVKGRTKSFAPYRHF